MSEQIDRRASLPELTPEEKLERYETFVRWALDSPRGTLLPVDGAIDSLIGRPLERVRAEPAPDLSLEDVARRFARTVRGSSRVPTRAAVRKWIREGNRGVKLEAYRFGTEYRVTEEGVQEFVEALRRLPSTRKTCDQSPAPMATRDPGEEIAAYEARYSRRDRIKKAS